MKSKIAMITTNKRHHHHFNLIFNLNSSNELKETHTHTWRKKERKKNWKSAETPNWGEKVN